MELSPNGETVLFDEAEQAEFNVPPEVPVEIALETAKAIEDAADKVARKQQRLLNEAEDDDSRGLHAANTRLARSMRLKSFALNTHEVILGHQFDS